MERSGSFDLGHVLDADSENHESPGRKVVDRILRVMYNDYITVMER
jgi:hypothetical protein